MSENYKLHEGETFEERKCAFCGETFYAWHGLQRYCPEKNGKAQYCKYEHKKLISEDKLVKKAEEYAKVLAYSIESAGLHNNHNIINNLMTGRSQKYVTADELDKAGFKLEFYDHRTLVNGSSRYMLTIGNYGIEFYSEKDNLIIFNIYVK